MIVIGKKKIHKDVKLVELWMTQNKTKLKHKYSFGLRGDFFSIFLKLDDLHSN